MKIQKAFLALLAFLVLLLAVLTLAMKSGQWSTYEKRALAEKPDFSAASLLSGETAAQTEDYLNDRVAFRERMLRLRVRLLTAAGKPAVNDVVVTEQALLPMPLGNAVTDAQRQNAEKIAQAYAKVQAQTQTFGGEFLYVLLPEQRSALRAQYPQELNSDGAYADACAELLLAAFDRYGVQYLDLRQTLGADAENYYKTDHHFSFTGANAAYRAICEACKLTPCDVSVQKTNCTLMGTYACKLFGVSAVQDAYEIYEPTVAFSREDDGSPSDRPLFAPAQGLVMYDAYMGGDFGETVLRTGRGELSDALIVGNSFTNMLEALLYQNFDETRSLDFRHYAAAPLTEYIAAHAPQYVIAVCDDQSCLTSSGNNMVQ